MDNNSLLGRLAASTIIRAIFMPAVALACTKILPAPLTKVKALFDKLYSHGYTSRQLKVNNFARILFLKQK